jgi:hypothetical protein
MARAAAFYLALLIGLALAWASALPPSPRPVDAPANVFSAERAMTDVRAIARAPHPIGSAENRRVRDYLLGRLTALGAETQVHRAPVYAGEWGAGAWVESVIGVVPGRDRTAPALALMAHYDSVPSSPGAADDAMGVAAILESVRALTRDGPPGRDVIVILTDGEEVGLFGARAFLDQHPWAKRIGLVVNLEARGSAGHAFMFETGRGNGETVDLYRQAVARPEASSLMVWVYERMPNGTDFTVFKDAGVQGINIAPIGRPFDYHSATSTPENLDRRSLQHMGDQTLAFARAAAAAEALPTRAPNAVYADLYGRLLVAYPAWVGWLVLAAAAALLTLAVRRASQDAPLPPASAARGAGLFVAVVAVAAVAIRAAYRLNPVGPDFYQSPLGAQFGLFFAGAALLGGGAALLTLRGAYGGAGRLWAIAPLVLGALCSVRGGFDPLGAGLGVAGALFVAATFGARPAEPRGAWAGLLAFGLLLAVLLQALAAETAFLAAWPVLAAAGAAAATRLGGDARPFATAVLALVAVLFLVWLGRMAAFLFDGLGLTSPELLAGFAGLLAFAWAPLVAAWTRSAPAPARQAAALALAGAAVLALVAVRQPWSPRTPEPSSVTYVVDLAAGRAWRVSRRPTLDGWTREAVAGAGGPVERRAFPALSDKPLWSAPARAVPLAAPVFAAAREGDRVRLRLVDTQARDLRITIESDAPVSVLSVEGRPHAPGDKAGNTAAVRWFAPDPDGIEIVLRASGPVRVGWATVRAGWPAGSAPLPPRPADVMPAGSTDTTTLIGQATVR